MLDPVLSRIDADLPDALGRLDALLRIPSISTDPAHAADCQAAADWLVADLRSLGLDAAAHPTPGRPAVVGSGGEGGRHLLFYGHYDVQPVDPLALWDTPPFEPAIQDTPSGRVIRARGASDDKGQLMTFVEACRAWIAVHGRLPARVTMFFEGEEESGSPSLPAFLEAHRDALAADIALICDTDLFDRDTPAICTALRGVMADEITVIGPDKDLHSGMYGGAAQNPIRVLARILASLHDDAGRVTIPGFYDGVDEVPADQRAQWDALGFDEARFLADVGLSIPAGERGRSVLESVWARPTCEFCGISGGYQGEGFKNVLPSRASAKVSCRLVGRQDPHAIRAALREAVRAQVPADCRVEFAAHGEAPASVMATTNPAFGAARRALADEWPGPVAFVGSGGSIPVAGLFRSILGMDSMLIGFALPDDRIHSPNEKYDVRSFHKGIRSWARILAALA